MLLGWFFLSLILWLWIFTFVTDAPRESKIVLFVNTPACRETELAVALEEDRPEAIRMVQVHAFNWAAMSTDPLIWSDLYIVRSSDIPDCLEWFAPLPEELAASGECYLSGGIPVGLKVRSSADGSAVASSFFTWTAENAPGEDYWLFFGKRSLHLSGNPDAVDDHAVPIAKKLLSLP